MREIIEQTILDLWAGGSPVCGPASQEMLIDVLCRQLKKQDIHNLSQQQIHQIAMNTAKKFERKLGFIGPLLKDYEHMVEEVVNGLRTSL